MKEDQLELLILLVMFIISCYIGIAAIETLTINKNYYV